MNHEQANKEKVRLFEALAEAERNHDIDAQAELMQQLIDLNDRSKRGETDEDNK